MIDLYANFKCFLFDRSHPGVSRLTMNRPERLNAADTWRVTEKQRPVLDPNRPL